MSNQFDFTHYALDATELPPGVCSDVLDSERRANQLLASNGSARRNIVLEGKDPTAFFYLSELQLPCSPRTPNSFYGARCIAERPNLPIWKRPSPRNKPSALISSSTTYQQDARYYKECIVALSEMGWETIIVAGSLLRDFDSLPARCHPIQHASLSSVMPHVDLLICAAGMATAMEALYHGLPMLMLSSGHAELKAYARMFQRRGLGIHLERADADLGNVAHHAARMYEDNELRLSVKRLQETVKRSPGAEEFVNWLEQHLSRS